MGGKIIGTVLALLTMTYLILLISFYYLHTEIKGNVKDINYDVCELIATSGEFSSELYDYLSTQVGKFGEYSIKLRLDRKIGSGIYDTSYDNSQILDKKLRMGDRVVIYLEDRHMSLFGKLINASFLGHVPDKILDTRVRSIKTAIVSRNAPDLLKGYDVIRDIKALPDDPNIAIEVITKMNPSGKVYGMSTHPDVETSNLIYGDTPDEYGNTGINYIFENGDFLREKVKYSTNGATRLIKYIQQ